MASGEFETKVLEPSEEAIALGVELILSGDLVAFPTETVYGLGGDATNPYSARRIYEAKGRPLDNPLIVHVSSLEDARSVGEMTDLAELLAQSFWPGPLTVVVPARPIIPVEVRGGLDTVAVRLPSNPVARDLICASGVPIAAPSANRSGRPSPTDAMAVLEDLGGRIPLILDGGPCVVGLESTVVDATGDIPVVLRHGGIDANAIGDVAGDVVSALGEELLRRSPGTRHRHYAPSVPVLLWDGADVDASILIEGPVGYVGLEDPPFCPDCSIRPAGVMDYARMLFRSFREFERSGMKLIVAQLPHEGDPMGEALRDRLMRASGGRLWGSGG